MEAFATFLERSPEAARARVTMLQITPKSRLEVPEYARMQRELEEEAGRINGKHGVRCAESAFGSRRCAPAFHSFRLSLISFGQKM
jgi:hypothetical protein